MEHNMIHVCLSFHDEQGLYSKLAGVALCSLFAHTKAEVTAHVLCDMPISEETRQSFANIAERYGQKIIFHQVKVQLSEKMLEKASRWTVGTLLRLYLPELLQVDKVIYLDADLIVNLDLAELWAMDISSYSIGACADEGFQAGWRRYELISSGMFEQQRYFNAGVMFLNLKRIRAEHNLLVEAIEFMAAHPECRFADQDALNAIFRHTTLLLPRKFNCMVAGCRRHNATEVDEVIYHYAGDDGRPRYLHGDAYDRIFLQYFQLTPWNNEKNREEFCAQQLAAKQENIRWLCDSEQKIRGRKKIFWGAGGCLHDALRQHFQVHAGDYYIDANKANQGTYKEGLLICPPAELAREVKGKFAVIVVTMQYVEVARTLQSYGLVENEDFFDGRRFLTESEGGYPCWSIV